MWHGDKAMCCYSGLSNRNACVIQCQTACHYTAVQPKEYKGNTIKCQDVSWSSLCRWQTFFSRNIILIQNNKDTAGVVEGQMVEGYFQTIWRVRQESEQLTRTKRRLLSGHTQISQSQWKTTSDSKMWEQRSEWSSCRQTGLFQKLNSSLNSFGSKKGKIKGWHFRVVRRLSQVCRCKN